MQGIAEPETADIENMTAKECISHGEQLIDTGRWQESERYFFAALEKAQKKNNIYIQVWATLFLGRICNMRGDFSQAIILYQQALLLAEPLNNQRLNGVIYSDIGANCQMQGRYLHTIEHYKKVIKISEQIGDENGLSLGYGNLGIVYRLLGDYKQAIESHKKSL